VQDNSPNFESRFRPAFFDVFTDYVQDNSPNFESRFRPAFFDVFTELPFDFAIADFDQDGRILRVRRQTGATTTFLYDRQRLLTGVVDEFGRLTRFGYDASGHLDRVTDPEGREVEYGYDGLGRLVSVRSPIVSGTPTGNDFPSGKVTRYEYSSPTGDGQLDGNLLRIFTPAQAGAAPTVEIAYGTTGFSRDRAVSIAVGGVNASGVPAGGAATLDWSALNAGADPSLADLPRRRCLLLDPAGNRRRIESNAQGLPLSLLEETNREVRPGEMDYLTRFAWDAEGRLTRLDWPSGASVEFTWDYAAPDRFRQGNLVRLQLAPDDARGDGHGGPAEPLVTTFDYEPIFNRVASITGPKGNDPLYVPPNGGAWSAERYTSRLTYDYQEGDFATNGIAALAARWGIDLGGAVCCLGDVNRDGRIDPPLGLPIECRPPQRTLYAGGYQAVIEGATQQDIALRFSFNEFGQIVRVVDPEANVCEFSYYPESDCDGDGVATPAPADGRLLDGDDGGLLRRVVLDALPDPLRDNRTDPLPAAVQRDYQYDALGRRIRQVDGRGVAHAVVLNALDQVVELRAAAATADAAGPHGDAATGRGETGLAPLAYRTQFLYDGDDNLVELRQEDIGATRGVGSFVVTNREYDILGHVVREMRPAGVASILSTSFSYDANGNPTGVTDLAGAVHTAEWDERDLPASVSIGADGPLGGLPHRVELAWSPRSKLAELNDPAAGLMIYDYDGHDRRVHARDAAGGEELLFLDPDSDVVRVLRRGTAGGPTPGDPSGTANVDLSDISLVRDELGTVALVKRRLLAPGAATMLRPPELAEGSLVPADGFVDSRIERDRASRPTFITDDSTRTTRCDYRGDGLLAACTVHVAAPALRMTWTHDAAGSLVEIERTEYSTGGIAAQTALHTAFYDALGRLTLAVSPSGRARRFAWNSLSDLGAASDANGPAGLTIERRSPAHSGEPVPVNGHGNVTRFVYDGLGRLVERTRVLTASGLGDGTLDPLPDLSNPDNPDGLSTVRIERSTIAPQLVILDDGIHATEYSYDNAARPVRRSNSDGTFATLEYDGRGLPALVVDENGTRHTSAFDVRGRLIGTTFSRAPGVEGTTTIGYEYDGLSRLTRVSDNNDPGTPDDDRTVLLGWDSLSRPLEELHRTPNAPDLAIDYGWLASDRMLSVVQPDGRSAALAYDPAGRCIQQTDSSGGWMQFSVVGLDRLVEIQHVSGLRSTALDDTGSQIVGLDEDGRITLWRHLAPGGTLLAGFEYRYDGTGRLVSSRQLHRPHAGGAFGRLLQRDSAGHVTGFRESTLDLAHLDLGPVSHSESFVLDGCGNRTRTVRDAAAFVNTPNNLDQYNEPQSGGVNQDDGLPDDYLDRLGTPPDGWNFAYDRAGSRTVSGPVRLAFDALGRPVRVTRAKDGVVTGRYAYDGLGRIVRRIDEAGAERLFFPSLALRRGVEERDAGGSVTRSALGPIPWMAPEMLAQQVQRPGLAPVLALGDGLNGAALTCDGSLPTLVLERVDIDPFGKPFFLDAAGIPLRDALGRWLADSIVAEPVLWRGARYLPELGNRAKTRLDDWGGCLAARASCLDPNTARVVSLNGLPPGQPETR
jgi:YD repeat-containing protein